LIFFIVFLSALGLATLLQTSHRPTLAYPSTPPGGEQVEQQSPSSWELLQQGKIYYQRGQLAEAAEVWQQATKASQGQGEILNQVQALNYLALVYQDLGKQGQAQTAIEKSLNLLQSRAPLNTQENLLLGQALNSQGTLQLFQGQTETALKTWKQATETYARVRDNNGKLISQINQAQALQALGQYRRAKSLLEQLTAELQGQADSLIKAQGLRSLGVALQTIGDPLQSKAILEESWSISQQLDSRADISAALFSIGNVAGDLQNYAMAWLYYQEAIKLAPDRLLQIEAQLNQLSMLVGLQKWEPALILIPQIETNLGQLPASRPSIYAKINLAESLGKIERFRDSDNTVLASNGPTIVQLLETGIEEAEQIQDPRAEAYSLYQLSKFYQEKRREIEAKTLAERSLKIAQEINAVDIVARAAAELGVILKGEGDIEGAISAYEVAFTNLQSLRGDLVAINSDVQFDFKESIEPIYRDFVSLLLTPTQQGDNKGEVSQAKLKQAREVMEALQLAELDNFFRDACLDTHPVVLDKIDVKAAVIYPIILQDRLEVILSLPNQPMRHYSTQLRREQLIDTLKQLYSSLSPGYPRDERLRLSQQVYDWLVSPAEADLQRSNTKTLVFIPDGFLRNLPMAALHDGSQYLIEKYSVALSPGLQLFAQGLQPKNLSVFAAGLTEARQGFNSLPGVAEELKEVTAEVPSEVLLNQKFTRDSFKTVIENQPFPIVHLATHGQFSSNPEETFLLTWSDRISIEDFDLLFQKRRLGILEPIELLVMSACQTAAGDNRATLGLAGFALRSGARSTLASLWSVSDESTASLMREFYHQLTVNKVSKAEALRQAQLKVMENPLYKHPYFWASFVLVGNWL
jgi:CHAT domain-containing protein